MERINLKKIGFERSPADDFSDDRNYFTCYRAGGVRVLKLVHDDQVYISARADMDGKLPYEMYSTLAHYKGLDTLNGVSKANLTEQDLVTLYLDCIAYEKEYNEMVESFPYPSKEELREHMQEARAARKEEYQAILEKLSANVEGLLELTRRPYHMSWESFCKYANQLKAAGEISDEKIEENVNALYHNASSVREMQRNPNEDSWSYKACLEYFTC